MTAPATLRQRRTSAAAAVTSRVAYPSAARSVVLRPVPCGPWSVPHRSGPAHLVAAFLVTFAVVGALGWLGQPGQPAEVGVSDETAVVRVGAGETVWDVARRVAPQADPRAVVERIHDLNGMASSAVQPGQQLEVPAGS